MFRALVLGLLVAQAWSQSTTTYSQFQTTGCTGTPVLTTAVTGCVGTFGFGQRYYCLANNKFGIGIWQTSPTCATTSYLYLEGTVGSCTVFNSKVVNCTGGPDTSPVVATADYVQLDTYAANTCTGTPTNTIYLLGTFGACNNGAKLYCSTLERFQSVVYADCSGAQFLYGKDIAGQCENTTGSGSTIEWSKGSCNQGSGTAPTVPTKSLTATALNTMTYTDNTCTTQTGWVQYSTGLCAETQAGSEWTQVACSGNSGTITKYNAAGCNAANMTATYTVGSTCVQIRGTFYKIESCGAPPTVGTSGGMRTGWLVAAMMVVVSVLATGK